MSIVSPEMIACWCKHYNVNADVAEGSLVMFEKGQGQPPADLFDGKECREVFKPLRSAYFAACGVAEPEYSNVDEPKDPKAGSDSAE